MFSQGENITLHYITLHITHYTFHKVKTLPANTDLTVFTKSIMSTVASCFISHLGGNWGEEIDILLKESYQHWAFPSLDLIVEKQNTNESQ